MLRLRFKVGLIMYISFEVTDQDLHLGLLESPLLISRLLSLTVCHLKVYHFVHILKLSCVTSIRVRNIVT